VDGSYSQRNGVAREPIRDRHFTSSLFRETASEGRRGWRRFCDVIACYVAHYARRAGIPAQDGEDLAQEVCIRIARGLGSYRGERTGDHLHRWVRAIVRNQVADYFRTRERRRRVEAADAAQCMLAQVADARGETVDSSEETAERKRILYRAMGIVRALVEPRSWEAFCAVVLERREPREVAAQLALTPHALRQAIYRVNRLLIRHAKEIADLCHDPG